MRWTTISGWRGRLAVVGMLAAMSAGCVGGSKGISGEDKARLQQYILDQAPADLPHPIDVNFENKIHLLGYQVTPETAGKGQEVKITYWWRCDDTVEDGWQLFTHVYDPVSKKSDNLDWAGPLREKRNEHQILSPDKWEKGKVYVDEMTYKVPDWVQGPELQLLPGIWKGDARLRILSGPSDNDNRAQAGTIKTGLKPAAPDANKDKHSRADIPDLAPVKLTAAQKINVDGKLDEAAWGTAVTTGPFVNVGNGNPDPGSPAQGSVKALWDDQNVYLGFEVTDQNLVGYFTDAKSQPDDWTVTGQPKDWSKETVEIMTDPGPAGDNKTYYELQINPQNKVFHSQFDEYNSPKTEPNGPFGHEDWDPKLKSAVVVNGTLDNPGDKDVGYTVEIAIPWTAFAKAKSDVVNLPPKPGDVWRMNFYAMKNNGGVSWSAIRGAGNFHRASRFGRVTWSTAAMAAAAAADAGAGDAGVTDSGAPAAVSDAGPMMHVPHHGVVAPAPHP